MRAVCNLPGYGCTTEHSTPTSNLHCDLLIKWYFTDHRLTQWMESVIKCMLVVMFTYQETAEVQKKQQICC